MKKPKEVPPPTPIEARKYAELDCAGNCGFVDKGVGLQCVKGDACTRMVHRDDKGYISILADLSKPQAPKAPGVDLLALAGYATKYQMTPVLHVERQYPGAPWQAIESSAEVDGKASLIHLRPLDGTDGTLASALARVDKRIAQANLKEEFPETVEVEPTPASIPDALAGAVVSKELDGLVEEILRPVDPIEVPPLPVADADDKLFDELLGHKADHEEHMKDQDSAQPPVDPETPAAS